MNISWGTALTLCPLTSSPCCNWSTINHTMMWFIVVESSIKTIFLLRWFQKRNTGSTSPYTVPRRAARRRRRRTRPQAHWSIIISFLFHQNTWGFLQYDRWGAGNTVMDRNWSDCFQNRRKLRGIAMHYCSKYNKYSIHLLLLLLISRLSSKYYY